MTLVWISIAGARWEPAEVKTEDGRKVARTIGCPDPFYLDDPDCPCVIYKNTYTNGELMERPEGPFTEKELEAQRKAYDRKIKRDEKLGIHHGWTGEKQ